MKDLINNTEQFTPGAGIEMELLAKLKSGENSSVYVLYDRICDRKAVLKTGSREVIENEARMLERSAGEGVPEVYLCFENDGQYCLLRRYEEGVSLSEYLETEGTFSPRQAVKIGIDICRIISRLHSLKPPIIHRDIKSDNVVIGPDGNVSVVDFGIAREYDLSLEHDTQVLGTPIIAPPEQFGFTQTDERSDVYAIGVLINELITGSVKTDTSKMPRRLAAVIKRCTEFSPANRYKNAAELEKALLKVYCERSKRLERAVKAASFLVLFGVIIATATICLPKAISGSFLSEQNSQEYGFDENGNYRFYEPAIESEVRRILGKDSQNITKSDLDSITQLMLVGDRSIDDCQGIIIHGTNITVKNESIEVFGNISSVEDLANMPNLSTVVLCNQHISDISPLSSLNIVTLYLHGNNISDISPLENISTLETLFISSNPVKDFSALAGLFRLSCLNIGATNIESLDDIAKLTGLIRLEIHDCPSLSDISALENINHLSFLSLRPATDEAIDIISNLTTINHLYLWEAYSLKNLDRLAKLYNLRDLVLDGCGIESIDRVGEYFPVLSYFTVRFDLVSDLSPLADAKNIHNLGISQLPVKDYSPLAEMDGLYEIFCSPEQLEKVSEVLKGREDVSIVIE